MDKKKRKILIVDDDNFLLDMYAFKFSQNGFEVETFLNGQEVLEKLKTGVMPEVILMDLIMPEMDGFELLEKMRSENLCPKAVKIVLSNKSQQADMDRCTDLGVACYIVKANSTPTEVVEQVKKVLEE